MVILKLTADDSFSISHHFNAVARHVGYVDAQQLLALRHAPDADVLIGAREQQLRALATYARATLYNTD